MLGLGKRWLSVMMMMWPTAATIQNPILLACFDTTTTISFYRHIVFCFAAHTVRNLHFLSKKFNFDFARKLSILFRLKNSWICCDFGLFSCWQLWFHEKNCRFFWWKIRENVLVLDYLAVDNFDFTRKIVDFFGEKFVKMFWFWTF